MAARNLWLSPRTVFQSFADARNSLSPIILHLNRQPIDRAATLFTLWCEAFDRFCFTYHERLRSHTDRKTYALIQLYRHSLEMEISAAIVGHNGNPLMWDRYGDTFREMICFAEQIHRSDDGDRDLINSKPQFHLEIGTVPIIYSIILKCRDPDIRGRGMSLLQSQRLQEGFWNSKTVSLIAQRVIALEGDGLLPTDIPDQVRVRQVLAKAGGSEEDFVIYYQLSHGWWNENIDTIAVPPGPDEVCN